MLLWVPMNLLHHWICSSASWKTSVKDRILPWAIGGLDLGDDVLEIGPGPGATTELLRSRVKNLTCVEMDPVFADALRGKDLGPNVRVVTGDAAQMTFPDQSFDGVVCFTMLHHVPSAALQDRLLCEAARVLRPGGIFAGTDSLYSRRFSLLHLFDTMTIVDPATFPDRLTAAGFVDVKVDVVKPHAFRFRAQRPASL